MEEAAHARAGDGVSERQRILRRWLLGYVALLLGTLPIAFPLWNRVLRDAVGSYITVEQIHLAEYAGLGWYACWYALADRRPRRTLLVLMGILAAVGVVDELIQGLLPHRWFEWSDVALNGAGGLIGMMIAGLVDWIIQRSRYGAAGNSGAP